MSSGRHALSVDVAIYWPLSTPFSDHWFPVLCFRLITLPPVANHVLVANCYSLSAFRLHSVFHTHPFHCFSPQKESRLNNIIEGIKTKRRDEDDPIPNERIPPAMLDDLEKRDDLDKKLPVSENEVAVEEIKKTSPVALPVKPEGEQIQYDWNGNVVILTKCFVSGCTGSCQNDNFQFSQWWKLASFPFEGYHP